MSTSKEHDAEAAIGAPRRSRALLLVALSLVLCAFAVSASAQSPTSEAPVLVAGYGHTCALQSGQVMCWGSNDVGQLGNGTTSNTPTTSPVAVPGMSGVQAITAGGSHVCVLKDGDVWCWGYNGFGQVGNNSVVNTTTPVKVAGLSGVRAVSAGGDHTCAIVTNGVKCWGNNSSGQLGINSTLYRSLLPVSVVSLPTTGIQSLSLGWFHSCVIVDGAAKCWGQNDMGQLGNNTSTNSLVPVPVQGLTSGVQAIAAETFTTCAIVNGGVQCWGANTSGNLGDGTFVWRRLVPGPVSGLGSGVRAIAMGRTGGCALFGGGVKCWGNVGAPSAPTEWVPVDVVGFESGVQAIAAGSLHYCALRDGRASCWGFNTTGQLGNGTVADSLTPVPVGNLLAERRITAAGHAHTCALVNGGVECVGSNLSGQLGDGTTVASAKPVRVVGLTSGVQAIASGRFHTCAIVNGGARCWGVNSQGQLGDGVVSAMSSTPVQVAGLTSGVQALAAGDDHTCALVNGGVRCWGVNQSGQLGSNSTTTWFGTPQQVSGFATGVQRIAAGGFQSCAIAGGAAWCWGGNSASQLARDPAVVPLSRVPLAITQLAAGVTSIAPGSFHTCAVANGAAKCWGSNLEGALGLGSTTPASSIAPVQVATLVSGVQDITSGARHVCALVNGGARCWGNNGEGMLGNNSAAAYSNAVVAVTDLGASVDTIDAGNFHVCAVVRGVVKCWGYDSSGQLASGVVTPNSRLPVTTLFSSVSAIASGTNHTCAIVNRRVQCWGSNGLGELGNTAVFQSETPMAVTLPTGDTGSLAAGDSHTCAVVNGSALCWGNNYEGQLGNGWADPTIDGGPAQVLGLTSGVQSVTAGGSHSCALVSGAVRCWGSNASGQLGIGTTTPSSYTPTPAMGLPLPAIAIAAGSEHTCALLTNGTVTCWGQNSQGQLGNGTTTSGPTPVEINTLWNVLAIAASGNRTCAAVRYLGVSCWGDNGNGTSTTTAPTSWISFGTTNTVRSVSASSGHSCAVGGIGAQCWGQNGSGQLGNGITTNSTFTPVAHASLPSALQSIGVSTGAAHSCAIVNDGVQCWGDNSLGQLGNALSPTEMPQSLVPVAVSAWAM